MNKKKNDSPCHYLSYTYSAGKDISKQQSSENETQHSIRIIYHHHELGLRDTHGVIPHFIPKELSIAVDIGLYGSYSIRIKESGMYQTLDNQIVRIVKWGCPSPIDDWTAM